MQATAITSASNENYKRWRKIVENYRNIRKLGLSIAEGIHLAQVLLANDAAVKSVIINAERAGAEAHDLAEKIVSKKGARAYLLDSSLYDAISPVEHGAGIALEFAVASVKKPVSPVMADALYLDGVQDAGNVGTLIRTAVAAGVRHIAASSNTAGFWTPKVMRAGMGAHFGATLYENVSVDEIPKVFGGRILAADARGGRDLFTTPGWEEGCTVWLMGAEGPGLSQKAVDMAECYLIDIENECESLNVGAAAAVCLFEQRRRRIMAARK